MNERIEKFLRPVTEAQPAGKDPSNDVRFDALETLLKGKPEVDLGNVKKPAEAPNWSEVRDQAASLAQESRHLRLAVVLGCSWLKVGGLPGFRDGLELTQGLLEQYWPTVYPLLDPDDSNDPTQRLNILRALTESRGSVTGWLTITDYLYAAPLCTPKGAPAVTYEHLLVVQGHPPGGAATSAPSTSSVENAIRTVAPADLTAMVDVLAQCLASAEKIDGFLTTTLGASNAINFEVLTTTLKGMVTALKPYLPRTDTDGAGEAENSGGESGGAFSISGAVRSREDVVRSLDAICGYYAQVEPSSPVPYLLKRAQKMAKMNFVEAVQELNLATLDTLKPSMGSGLGDVPPPAA